MSRFSVETIFKAIDKVTAPISKMQNRIQRFARSTQIAMRKASASFSRFENGVKSATRFARNSLLILGAAGTKVIGTFATFEQSLVNAAAKFPSAIKRGTKAFSGLEEAARKVGRETEFRATEAAEGLNFLAMAGFNAEQSIAALPGLVDLATASQIDLARASDIATDTLGAFDLRSLDAAKNAENLARVNDVLARATTSSNTDMEQLFETMKTSGAVVSSLGGDIETFAALAGTLANAGLKGTNASTALKNAFIRLAAPQSKASKLLRRYNVEVDDGTGNMRDMFNILGDMEKALKGIGNVKQAQILNEVFGLRAITGGNILLKKGFKGLNDYREMLRRANGASKEMADTMRNTLLGRWKALLSAVESVFISLGDLKSKGIEGVIESMTRWVRALDLAINKNKELVEDILQDFMTIIVESTRLLWLFIKAWIALKIVVIAVRAVIISYTAIMALWKVATIAWTVVQWLATGAMVAFNVALMATPLGWIHKIVLGVVVVFTALTAAIIYLWDNWESIWKGIKDITGGAIDFIMGLINPFIESISAIADAFASLFEEDKVAKIKTVVEEINDGSGVVSSGQSTAARMSESRHISEVLLKTEKGVSAAAVGSSLGDGISIVPSGG